MKSDRMQMKMKKRSSVFAEISVRAKNVLLSNGYNDVKSVREAIKCGDLRPNSSSTKRSQRIDGYGDAIHYEVCKWLDVPA